jgi:hypothetical protein
MGCLESRQLTGRFGKGDFFMRTSSHVKLTICCFLLFLMAVDLGLLLPARGKADAATTKTGGCGSWHLVSSPNTGGLSVLEGVAAGINTVWAVGYSSDRSFTNIYTLTEHWNGKRWSIIPSPNTHFGINLLIGVARIPGALQVWAVGYSEDIFGNDDPLIEYWNGTSWKIIPSPKVPGSSVLSSVTALSANTVWAVGYTTQSDGSELTLTERWNGTSWKIIPSPNGKTASRSLSGVGRVPGTRHLWAVGSWSASPGRKLAGQLNETSWKIVSNSHGMPTYRYPSGVGGVPDASQMWAVGSSSGSNQTLAEQWNGTSWKIVSSPDVGSDDSLYGVGVASWRTVWSVGNYYNGRIYQPLVELWNGTTWSVGHAPSPGDNASLLAVAVVSGSSAWAVGSYHTGKANLTLIERANGTTWSVVAGASPGSVNNFLYGVSATPGTNQVWAVGMYQNNGPARTLIESSC